VILITARLGTGVRNRRIRGCASASRLSHADMTPSPIESPTDPYTSAITQSNPKKPVPCPSMPHIASAPPPQHPQSTWQPPYGLNHKADPLPRLPPPRSHQRLRTLAITMLHVDSHCCSCAQTMKRASDVYVAQRGIT
jgi:hypothetical protein